MLDLPEAKKRAPADEVPEPGDEHEPLIAIVVDDEIELIERHGTFWPIRRMLDD